MSNYGKGLLSHFNQVPYDFMIILGSNISRAFKGTIDPLCRGRRSQKLLLV